MKQLTFIQDGYYFKGSVNVWLISTTFLMIEDRTIIFCSKTTEPTYLPLTNHLRTILTL